jgi:hypothetical protein
MAEAAITKTQTADNLVEKVVQALNGKDQPAMVIPELNIGAPVSQEASIAAVAVSVTTAGPSSDAKNEIKGTVVAESQAENKSPKKDLRQLAIEFIEATKEIVAEYKATAFKNTNGGSVKVTDSWGSRANFIQIIDALTTKYYEYFQLLLGQITTKTLPGGREVQKSADDLKADEIFASTYLEPQRELIKALIEMRDAYYDLAPPLQKLLNQNPPDDGDCTCKTRNCWAHVYQIPYDYATMTTRVNPKMPLGTIEPHVLFQMLVLRVRNFLWSMCRKKQLRLTRKIWTEMSAEQKSGYASLIRSVYNKMSSADEEANWHSEPLDAPEYKYNIKDEDGKDCLDAEGKVIATTFAADFNGWVKRQHYLAGDEKMPAAHEQIKDAFDKAIAAQYAFANQKKIERTQAAVATSGVKGKRIKLTGFTDS